MNPYAVLHARATIEPGPAAWDLLDRLAKTYIGPDETVPGTTIRWVHRALRDPKDRRRRTVGLRPRGHPPPDSDALARLAPTPESASDHPASAMSPKRQRGRHSWIGREGAAVAAPARLARRSRIALGERQSAASMQLAIHTCFQTVLASHREPALPAYQVAQAFSPVIAASAPPRYGLWKSGPVRKQPERTDGPPRPAGRAPEVSAPAAGQLRCQPSVLGGGWRPQRRRRWACSSMSPGLARPSSSREAHPDSDRPLARTLALSAKLALSCASLRDLPRSVMPFLRRSHPRLSRICARAGGALRRQRARRAEGRRFHRPGARSAARSFKV